MTRRDQETASDVQADVLKAARRAGYLAALAQMRWEIERERELQRDVVDDARNVTWHRALLIRIDRLQMDLEKR